MFQPALLTMLFLYHVLHFWPCYIYSLYIHKGWKDFQSHDSFLHLFRKTMPISIPKGYFLLPVFQYLVVWKIPEKANAPFFLDDQKVPLEFTEGELDLPHSLNTSISIPMQILLYLQVWPYLIVASCYTCMHSTQVFLGKLPTSLFKPKYYVFKFVMTIITG